MTDKGKSVHPTLEKVSLVEEFQYFARQYILYEHTQHPHFLN